MSNRARDAFHEELQAALTDIELAIASMEARAKQAETNVFAMLVPDGTLSIVPLLLAKSNVLLAISNLESQD